jgi:hypothetical protein
MTRRDKAASSASKKQLKHGTGTETDQTDQKRTYKGRETVLFEWMSENSDEAFERFEHWDAARLFHAAMTEKKMWQWYDSYVNEFTNFASKDLEISRILMINYNVHKILGNDTATMDILATVCLKWSVRRINQRRAKLFSVISNRRGRGSVRDPTLVRREHLAGYVEHGNHTQAGST